MGTNDSNVLRGTLDMLILTALSMGEMHGWGICERIRTVSGDVLEVSQGSLYPALERIARSGWITSEWQTTESGRRARFYRLTAAGREQMTEEIAGWSRAAGAVDRVLANAGCDR